MYYANEWHIFLKSQEITKCDCDAEETINGAGGEPPGNANEPTRLSHLVRKSTYVYTIQHDNSL